MDWANREGSGGCNTRKEGLSFSQGDGEKRQRVVERAISELRVLKEKSQMLVANQ